jgi:hypothetical protein
MEPVMVKLATLFLALALIGGLAAPSGSYGSLAAAPINALLAP